MVTADKRLYILLFASCILAYVWLGYVYLHTPNQAANTASICMIKQVTGFACPSCGATRSVASLMHGNVQQALYLNPLGFVIALLMVIIPIWIVYDFSLRKKSFIAFYAKMEALFKNKSVAIAAIVLVLLNWAWNLSKGI